MNSLVRKKAVGDETTAYAKAVVKGKIIAGKHVINACQRHLNDLEKGNERGIYFDKDAAQRIFRFCRTVLKLAGGKHEGQPFNPLPWQCFLLGSIFGWKNTQGTRRFRRVYVETAKGSGKSPLAAAIGLIMMFLEGEARAEVYSAAPTLDQAKILFNDAKAMVNLNQKLSNVIEYSGGENRPNLAHHSSGSFFRPISSDEKKSGFRPYCALVDELHEHPNSVTLDMLEAGFKGREDPLLFMITNSGFDRKSICYKEHTFAAKVAAGDIQYDSAFGLIYTVDEDDDPFSNEKCWAKANPSLGHTIKVDYLRLQVQTANAIEGKKSIIARLHFSMWTDSDKSWLERKAWEACEDENLDIADFIGKKCWAGLDLSSTRDITALALVFEDGVNKEGRPCFVAFAHGFTPAQTLQERAKQDQTPYDVWVEKGFLTATDGRVVRYDFVAQKLIDWSQDYDLQNLAYDNWSFLKFSEELSLLGGNIETIQHPQGFNRAKDSDLSMPSSIDVFEALIFEGRLKVAVNPTVRSAVMAAKMTLSPSGLRKFDKQKATGRIDMCVALAMACGAANSRTEAVGESYLATNDMFVLRF